MPTRRINQVYKSQFGHDYTKLYVDETWQRSPRVNGRLKLQANPFSRFYYSNEYYEAITRFGSSLMGGARIVSVDGTDMDRLLVESYARIRGKLYKGSAALGVTLGSYKQSREMIVKRYEMLSGRADYWENLFRRKRLVTAKDASRFHLEVIFGWTPLLNDIHAATSSVIQLAPVFQPVTVRSTSSFVEKTSGRNGDAMVYYSTAGRRSVTRSAIFYVTNQNTWLAERAGLLNPVAVAWDLVPWSFVVNIFVNTGQLVNSITDFAGLDWRNASLTKNVKIRRQETWTAFANNGAYWKKGDPWGKLNWHGNRKVTTLDALARPPLVFKLPEANWGTAAMAASLFVQKFSRILPFLDRFSLFKRGY